MLPVSQRGNRIISHFSATGGCHQVKPPIMNDHVWANGSETITKCCVKDHRRGATFEIRQSRYAHSGLQCPAGYWLDFIAIDISIAVADAITVFAVVLT